MRQNEIIIVAGRKGCGKTYLTKKIVAGCRRLIILDSLHEYDAGLISITPDQVYEALKNPQYRVIYRPCDDNVGDMPVIDWISYLAMDRRNMTLVIEEADRYTNDKYLSEGLRQLVHYGRHYSVDMVFVTRMIQRIRSDVSAQADDILVFQMQGETSLKYLKGLSDIPDVEDRVKRLGKYQYLPIAGDGKLLLDKKTALH